MLADKPEFNVVARELNQWFQEQQNGRPGVLVSHNTAVDIQFLLCEYIRSKTPFPASIRLGLDTEKTLKRFTTIEYRKVSAEDWPGGEDGLTSKGAPSMGVKYCAMYALSKRSPPQLFQDVCGQHHDAEADTKAIAVILFDQEQFSRGLYHCVFKSGKKCCLPIKEIHDRMVIKMSEPPMKIQPIPTGWVPAPV